MRVPTFVAAAALGAMALAACGSGSSYSSPASSYSSPAATAPAAVTTTAKAGTTALGPVLVDADGRTLYGSTADRNGMPSCTGACAAAWPPVIVNGTALPAGLDAKIFSVVARPDGSHQLVAGTWPLYRFAGDAQAGDTNGQGTEGFFVATPNGTLNKGV